MITSVKTYPYAVMVTVLLSSYATGAPAENGPQPILRLDITQANPGSLQRCGSTPVLFSTIQGQLVMVQGNTGNSNDSLVSDDQGRTWHKWEAYSTWPKIYYQDVVRRGNELLAFGLDNKDALKDAFKGTHVWWSNDEGKTWAGGKRLTPDTDRWVTMVNRILVTRSGRVIVPVDQLLGDEGPDPCKIGTIYSDDGGRSWQRSPIFGPPPGYPTKPEGLGEPAVVELANGKMWMVCRGLGGHLWQSFSDDGGATWCTPSPTTLISPLSAVNAKRIPGSGAVIVFWNHARPGTSTNWNDVNNFWRPRSPLVFAVSKDNCRSWGRPVTVTPGTATYPAICFLGDKMFVEFWEDPDPKAVYGNPKSHLILLAYDIPALLSICGQTAAAENLLVNGDFETWTDDRPDHWTIVRVRPYAAILNDFQIWTDGKPNPWTAEACKVSPSADGTGHGGHGRAAILETSSPNKWVFCQYPQVAFKDGQCVRFSVWLKLLGDNPLGNAMIQVGSTNGPPPNNTILGSNQLQVRPVKGEYRKFSVVHRLAPGGKNVYAAIVTDPPHRFFVDDAVLEFTDEPPIREPIGYIRQDVPNVKMPAYKGERYEAVAPDTLDLQEMGALAVHGATSCVDPQADYEIYWRVFLCGNRPAMYRDVNHQVQLIMQRGIPLMRLVSGTRENKQVEQRWLEVLFHLRGPDDLLYYPLRGRPWIHYADSADPGEEYNNFPGDQYTGPLNNGWSAELLGLNYRLTHDQRFREMGEKLTDAIIKHAVHREDYAFDPKGIYGLGETPDPNSPISPHWAMNAVMGWPCASLVQFYRATGYRPALSMSGKLARFAWKHSGMFDSDARWLASRHCVWHTANLFAILEYATETGDREMIEFVRKGYEYAKLPAQNMEMLTGFTPEYAEPTGQTGEICGLAWMLNLAVKLSAAGVGDYWDDVDRWVRNHFAEGQLTRCEWMDQVARDWPKPPIDAVSLSDDKVAQKNIGNFAGWPAPNDFYGGPQARGSTDIFMHCCIGEGSAALYRVWENILRYKDGKLKVNLLLNRASPWADVDSFIPYEGRVDVKIKTACELSVRIPEWVKPAEVKCQVGGMNRPLSWDGRYAVVGKAGPKDAVTLTFPIFERTDKVKIQGNEYTLIRKGNDMVHIDPPGKYCPLYQRDKYRENKVRTKNVERFVARQQIEW